MNKERLLKLADHLDRGELAHKKFDFNVIDEGPLTEKGCGTIGCALGELPAVFKEWRYSEVGQPVPFDDKGKNVLSWGDAAAFFDITYHEADFLFIPFSGNSDDEEDEQNAPNNLISGLADRKEVAAHIRKFVEHGGIYL